MSDVEKIKPRKAKKLSTALLLPLCPKFVTFFLLVKNVAKVVDLFNYNKGQLL